MTVRVRPAIARDVVVQRRVAGGWRYFGSGTTGSNGVTRGAFKSPAAGQQYRVVLDRVARGTTTYTAATSTPQRLRVDTQHLTLQLDDRTIAAGDRVRAEVHGTPVRAGRRVEIQERVGSRWRTVRRGAVDRHGRADFMLAPELGRSSFRAVLRPSRGAASVNSAVATVIASDLTPPPAPYDLVAEPGAGSISLSWSRSRPADFDHHEVWVRAQDTTWSVVGLTTATTFALDDLETGATYSITVTSVDTSGNRSAPAQGLSVTLEPSVERLTAR